MLSRFRSGMSAGAYFNTLRAYVFLAMLAVVLIPLGFIMSNRQEAAFERELAKVEQAHLLIAKNLASTLERYANDAVATFDFLAANYEAETGADALEPLLQSYGFRILGARKGGDGSLDVKYVRNVALPKAADLKELRQSATPGETRISPIRQVNGVPLLFLSKVDSTGTLYFGALDASFPIAQQKAIAFGERGHAMIVDQDGRVIAHPKQEWTETSKDASGLDVVQRMISRETGVMQFFSPPLQADMIAGYTNVPATGWGVMVPQPVSELRQAASVEAQEIMRILLLLFLLAAVMSWLLSGLIVRPVERISQTVAKVLDGDSSARVPKLGIFSPVELRSMRRLLNGLMEHWHESRAMLEGSLEAARQANASKSQAISVLSHEMRTPLNGILGAVGLMDATNLDPSQRKYLSIANTSAHTLLDHVNRVLEVSRLDSCEVSVERSEVDLRGMLTDIVKENTPQARVAGNEITLNLPDNLPLAVETDGRKLRSITANLVGNAVKFTRNGEIAISARVVGGDALELKIEDTGPGINNDDMDKIFEPFAVLNSNYSRAQEGTGLGLCIVAMSAEAMGGDVSVDSEIGRGSVFSVRVPVEIVATAASTSLAIPTSSEETSKLAEDRHVLVVDDNEINRTVLAEMLRTLGHRVSLAHDGKSAIESAMLQRFDLILMDISMPGMDGTEVARFLRSQSGPNQSSPIVAQTAHASPNDHDRFSAAGMQDVLTKPISGDAIRGLMAAAFLQSRDKDPEPASKSVPTVFCDEQLEVLVSAMGQAKALRNIEKMLDETTLVLDQLSDKSLLDASGEARIAQVHNVAGACATLGAKYLHAHLRELEDRLKSGVTKGIGDLLESASRATEITRSSLSVFRRQMHRSI